MPLRQGAVSGCADRRPGHGAALHMFVLPHAWCDCCFGIKDLTITEGVDALTAYGFNTKAAIHYFCSVCGIYTHHRRRSNPNEFGVNVACLEGVSPFDFEEVIVTDGVNHPSDGQVGSGIAGCLRFVPVR